MFTIIMVILTGGLVFILLLSLQLIIMMFKEVISLNVMIIKDFCRLFSGFGNRQSSNYNNSSEKKDNTRTKSYSNSIISNSSAGEGFSKHKDYKPGSSMRVSVALTNSNYLHEKSLGSQEETHKQQEPRSTKLEYNPLQPMHGFYVPASSQPMVLDEKFISECNRYVRQRDLEEEKENKYADKTRHIKKTKNSKKSIYKVEKRQQANDLKKKIKSYSYIDEKIDQYRNMTFSKHESIAAALNFETSELAQYKDYLFAVIHIYMDYGYITAGMVSYALDIPLKYAVMFTYYLFGQEYPEAESTIDYELLELALNKLMIAEGESKKVVEGKCDLNPESSTKGY